MNERSGAAILEPRGKSAAELQDIVAAADTGARNPLGPTGKLLFLTALAWSLFQLWIASPLPFMLRFGVFNSTEARSIHLAFAVFLAFTSYPAFASSPRDHVPIADWIMAILGAASAAYLYVFYASISSRVGAPIAQDYVAAVIGMLLLLEATRRALGPALAIVAIVFLAYTFLGPYMPGIIAHKGNSLGEVVNHHWITTSGVFGIASYILLLAAPFALIGRRDAFFVHRLYIVLCLVTSTFIHGLIDAPFGHDMGVNTYTLLTVIVMAVFRKDSQDKGAENQDRTASAAQTA